MKMQNTNPAEVTATIELTYMEARKLKDILTTEAKSYSELAVDYLNSGDTRYAELAAKKYKQAKTILSKINTIL